MAKDRPEGRGKSVEKAKDPRAAVRFLWRYLKEFGFLLFVALLLTLFSNTFALIGPRLSGNAIDALKGELKK